MASLLAAWWHEAVLQRLRLLRHVGLAGAPLAGALLLVDTLLGLLPVAFVVASSTVVARVAPAIAADAGPAARDSLVHAFLLTAGLFLAQTVLTAVQSSLGEVVTRRIDGHLQRRLISTSLHSTGIAPLEDPRALDALGEAGRCFEARAHTPGAACAGLLALLSRYLRLVAFLLLVGVAVSWPASAALTAAVALFRTGLRGGLRRFVRVYDRASAELRRSAYLRDVAMGAGDAKELRVFGLAAWFAGLYERSYRAAHREIAKARRRALFLPYLGYAAFGLAVTACAFGYLAWTAAADEVPLRDLVLGLQAALGAVLLGGPYAEADLPVSLGTRTLAALETFTRRIEAAERRNPLASGTGAFRRLAATVRLETVGFAYPGAGRPVFEDLDLELPQGVCTAIVGVNGAGKTTLVKLLTRLYDPDSGRITAGGVDIRDVPPEVWRRQVSVVFQDFIRYELSVADNIAFGAAHLPRDESAIRAAARQAGILEAVDVLPSGFDTVLSRAYEGGADLSGGQWQRVAIARSLYAMHGGAGLLVLDEPTSALDVRAEAAFFDSFVEVARGVTSVLISHRFSSIRRADRILVLHEGRIVEQGSHDELMARGDRYHDLFRLQADRFADA